MVRGATDVVRAALRSQDGERTWVVKVGDFVGKPRLRRVGNNDVMVNARVERIHCLGVEFRYEDKNISGLFLR